MSGIRVIQLILTGASYLLILGLVCSGVWSFVAFADWVYRLYVANGLHPWHVLVSCSVLLVVTKLVLLRIDTRWGPL